MEKQVIYVNEKEISIPAYYEIGKAKQDDPQGLVPFRVRTNHAFCLIVATPVDYTESLPREKNDLINGIREYLEENQGLIQVEVEKDYVFSIVKNLNSPSGVTYILTYQKFYPDFIINIQGVFEECGDTGIRDNVIFGQLRNSGKVGNENDPFYGWMKDPYDSNIAVGARMNVSELEIYDEMFPGFPLSMCREFIRCLIDG